MKPSGIVSAGGVKTSLRPSGSVKILEGAKVAANIAAAPILLIALWQGMASAGLLLEVVLPSPVKVILALKEMILDGTLFLDFKTSGVRVLSGYFWGCIVGVAVGITSGISKPMERLVAPIITVIRQIPMYAWMPLIILWFGIGETSKVVIIAEMVFVPVFVNTLQGVRNVSGDYVEVARALELSYGKLLRKVILPSAMPSIFVGLRLGAGSAWMAVVASEMLGGLSGLGFGLLKAREFVRADNLLALMIVIGVLGLLCDRLICLIAKDSLRWRNGFEGGK
jgi:sulfonate transport system permease protein